jgi:hypothetical protein
VACIEALLMVRRAPFTTETLPAHDREENVRGVPTVNVPPAAGPCTVVTESTAAVFRVDLPAYQAET